MLIDNEFSRLYFLIQLKYLDNLDFHIITQLKSDFNIFNTIEFMYLVLLN